jgi:hypothetical protein
MTKMIKKMSKKLCSSIALILIFSLSAPSLYAQSGTGSGTGVSTSGSTMETGNYGLGARSTGTTGTTSTTTTTTSDTVGSGMSSTTTTDCINVKQQGRLCGALATTYCNSHTTSVECRNFTGSSSTSSGTSTDSSMGTSSTPSTGPR